MTNAFGLHIKDSLLGDLITSANLDTMLSDGKYQAGFKSLLGTASHLKMLLNNPDNLEIIYESDVACNLLFNNRDAINELLQSDSAVELMMRNTNALLNFTDSQVALNIAHSSLSILTLINQFINVDGYKLKRQVFTSSGTLTYSDTILKSNEFGVGDGGSGSTVSTSFQVGYGGGGGEVVCKTKTSSFIPSTSAVSITDGNNTTVGTTLFVATKGVSGDNDPPTTGTGGGTTTGDNIELFLPNVFNLDPTTAIWYYGNWTKKGGDGGTVTGLEATASDGTPASTKLGTGGVWVSQTSGGLASTGYGSGGAGGGDWGSAGTNNGTNAEGYGCGGNSANQGGPGGAGSNGLFVMNYII